MFTIKEIVIGLSLFGIALGQTATGTPGTTPSIPTRPGLRDPSCPYPAFNVTYLPHYQDCSKYYQCYDGYKYLLQCSKGLWWDQWREMCSYSRDYCNAALYQSTTTSSRSTDGWLTTAWPTTTWPTTAWPTSQTSTDSTTTGTTGTTSTPVDPRCPHGSDRYLPLPGECHFYVECRNDRSFIIACPPKLYFSEIRKLCVPKEQSECCRLHTCTS